MQTAVVRTATSYIVGLVVSLLLSANIQASEEFTANLTAILTFIVGTIYYIAVKALEKKWPKLGWLLGSPNAPVYPTKNLEQASKAVDKGIQKMTSVSGVDLAVVATEPSEVAVPEPTEALVVPVREPQEGDEESDVSDEPLDDER